MTDLVVLDGNSVPQNMRVVVNGDGSFSYAVVLQDPVTGALASVNAGALVSSPAAVSPTFRFSALSFAPVASPTDFIVIQGSATMAIRIKKIKLTGVAGSRGNMPIQIVRRSSAGSGGAITQGFVQAGAHDTNDGNPTALVYTIGGVNYTTVGTTVGVIGAGRLGLCTNATGEPKELVWDFSRNQDKPVILRGILDFVCINAAGADLPAGAAIDFEIELEESTI